MLAKPQARFPGLNRHHPLAFGLANIWPLWEGAGTGAKDLASPNDGTFVNLNSTDWIADDQGHTLDFAGGSSEAIDCGSTPALYSTQQFTLSGYLSKASASDLAVLGTGSLSTSHRCDILWFTDGNVYCELNANFTNTPLAGTGRHFITRTFDGRQANALKTRIWIDGTERVTANVTNVTVTSSGVDQGKFYIGRGSSTTRYSTGQHSLAMIHNYALSPQLIELLHQDPFVVFRKPHRIPILSAGVTAPSGGLFRRGNLDGLGAGGPFFSDPLAA